MARTPKGQIIERKTRRSGQSYAARFQMAGTRYFITLGNAADGWTRPKAEQELQNILADVRRGIWKPPAPEPVPVPDIDADPTFWQFASDWFEANRASWAENTVKDYRWQVCDHLLPFFAHHRLSQITVAEVDRYSQSKLRHSSLGPESINKTLTRLGQILEVAVEYELIAKNSVRIGKRKLKVSRYERGYLDNADHIVAVLDAARELEFAARSDRKGRRDTLIAVLMFTGMRISEACALRWRHVDLAGGRLRVPGTKSDAAARWVRMLPVLRDELAALKAGCGLTSPDDFVLTTARGTPRTKDNARQRVWVPVIKRANENLVRRDLPPLPEGITQHSLRMTCCSLRLAMGEDLAYVAEQLGHADTSVTHRYYLRVMRMEPNDRELLRSLVEGELESHQRMRHTPPRSSLPS